MKNLDLGIIGNCRSCALIDKKASITWCCLPDFDSASVFGKILDPQKGGSFSISPVGKYKITQKYLKRTNILVTQFSNGKDEFEVIDFMPRYVTPTGQYHSPPDIIRYIHLWKGKPKFKVKYDPKPGYAKHPAKNTVNHKYIKSFTQGSPYESLYLYSDINYNDIIKSKTIELDSNKFLLLSYNQKIQIPNLDHIILEYERTKVYWLDWISRTKTTQKYKQHIERSALVLKLLTYQKTGAILAAATTSLPETIGDVRNWDYRFCWIRDASMTIKVLTDLGHKNVARRFLEFILNIIPYKDDKIQIMYGIRGAKKLTEKELDWLTGYENSKPVRIGNAAYIQKQNDIYGVLMDVIYQSLITFGANLDIREGLWTVVRTLVRHVQNNWKKPDRGIWELRSSKKHFTFSKILCWVALDRAYKIAEFLEQDEYIEDWAKLRDDIKSEILKKGVDKQLHYLKQSYTENCLDAANLLAEHYGFLSGDDPIYKNTVIQSYRKLCEKGLMYRYRTPDDFGEPESSFTVCTFWMIKGLAKCGEIELAAKMFEKVLKYSNHLKLFSEDIDFKTKRLLGNFPQAYCHLALIDTAKTIEQLSSS